MLTVIFIVIHLSDFLEYLKDSKIVKTIFVRNKIINYIVKNEKN